MSPSEIGEHLAAEIWAQRGRALLLHRDAYLKAVDEVLKRGGDRRYFDRTLGQLAADANVLIWPKLPPGNRGKPRRRRASPSRLVADRRQS